MRQVFGFIRHTLGGNYIPKDSASFVLLFLPRTGSNYLAAMLDSHPEITCHHELFNPKGIHRSLSFKLSPSEWTVAERDADPWRFLHDIYSDTRGKRAVGFKLSPGENNWAFTSLLLNRRVKKVLLTRKDWLQAYTSVRIAEETRQWIKMAGTEGESNAGAPDQVKVNVNPRRLLRFIRRRTMFYALIQRFLTLTFQQHFVLDYEQIGDLGVRARLLDFLGVSPSDMLVERTKKQNSARLEDRIANYDEVKHELSGTPYALVGGKE